MTDTILAWHFVGASLRDGRPIPADGKVLVHRGKIELCKSGLHASRRIIDALQYAPGETICRVECWHGVIEAGDKLACRRRRILWRVDGAKLLREFARSCALDVAHLWPAPDIVLDYLRAGDETIRAAARAASSAARDAASYAARAAMAASSAAISAARDAASSAARDAARDAAWGARDAWAARDAASSAASSAARDAARDAQDTRLAAMVERAHAGAVA